MANLAKKLHGLRAVLTEGLCSLSFQKIDSENILVILKIGVIRGTMHVTVSQLHEIPNRLDQWDREEMDDEN